MSCGVTIDIPASPATVWSLLTRAQDYPRWNSTVSRIEGEIAPGARLALQVPAAPGRTFRPRVVEFEPMKRMVWADGFAPMFKGTRSYALSESAGGVTRFSMDEVFSGLMLPLIRGSLPDFGPIFERFALDLREAAVNHGSKS